MASRWRTGKPITWLLHGREMLVANLASQNSLMRTLVGLSELTGEASYRETAEAAVRFTFDRLSDQRGLLFWGHHVAYDPASDRVFGHKPESLNHELKANYPFYELMWQVDPQATRNYIEAYWDAHIRDWSTLDFSRHGKYGKGKPPKSVWSRTYIGGETFFLGTGLGFLNAGSDLYFAAGMLGALADDPAPRAWALRMAGRYAQTRHPVTGLTGYQFSRIAEDRARVQLGPELGPYALEGTVLSRRHYHIVYGQTAICQLMLAERLGEAGQPMRDWVHRNLLAFADQAYDPEHNLALAMLTDGRRLTPEDVMKRPGYYKPAEFAPAPVGALILRAAATAYRIIGDDRLWQLARDIAHGLGLGEWTKPDEPPQPSDLQAECSDPDALFAVLEMYRATEHGGWLDFGRALADQMVKLRHHRGLFIDSPNHLYAKFDRHEPVALLHLAAAERGEPDAVPVDQAGKAFFAGNHDDATTDRGWGRLHDTALYYNRLAKDASAPA